MPKHFAGIRPRPVLPRRMWRYPAQGTPFEQLRNLSPRQRYIAEQSMQRYERNHTGGVKVTVLRGEVGRVDGVHIITSGGPFADCAPIRFVEPGDDRFGVVTIDAKL